MLERGAAPDKPLPRFEYDQRDRRSALFQEHLLERLSQLPGVMAVGSISNLPMTGQRNGTFLIDNDPTNAGYGEFRLASSGYFAAMRIPLLHGRLFDPSDRPDSPHVAVVSQSLAQKYWPNETPIGERIQFGNMDGDLRLLHIVGIVGDVRDRGLDSNVSPTVYAYALQRPLTFGLSMVVRAQTDTATLVHAMRQAVRALDPNLPANFRTLEQIFSSSLDSRRFSLVVSGVFATVALVLAVMGIYGMMSYAVTQRTHEIGVRMALGARQSDVLTMVLGQGMILVMVGVGIGLAGALAVTRVLSSLLYGVTATDPATLLGVSLLLVVVALLANYLPARKATRVDPMVALRYE